jgi:hypothetical protein
MDIFITKVIGRMLAGYLTLADTMGRVKVR